MNAESNSKKCITACNRATYITTITFVIVTIICIIVLFTVTRKNDKNISKDCLSFGAQTRKYLDDAINSVERVNRAIIGQKY